MSDIRKAIMSRLGEFARPGAKEVFAAQFQVGRVYEHAWANDSDSYGFWKVISRSGSMMVVQDVGSGGRVRTTDPQDIRYVESPRSGEQKRVKIHSDDRGEYAYPTGKYSMAPIIRATHPKSSRWSRPGAKAEMQKEYVLWGLPKGKTDAIHEQVLSTKAKTPAEMDAIKRRAAADGWHSFRVQILDLSKPYKGFGFSRPGAKAAFAADAGAVAKEILRQLGGGRFMSMVGGKNAMHGMFNGKPGLQVSIGKGAEGGINRLIVTLDPATDTYDMEFWRIANRGLSTKKVSEAHGVYADDLQRVFTDRTKFYTSMSRPGAKAAMAKWTVVMPSIPDAGTRHFDSWEQAKNYVDTKMGGFTALVSVDGKRYALKHALGQWEKYSRPGAKSTNAVHAGALAMAQANYNRAKRELDEAQERLDAFLRVGQSEQRIAQAERGVALAEQRFKDAEKALRSLNARPSAKIANALSDACWQGYEAVGTKKQDGKTVPNCVPKATAAKPAETPAMRELGRKMQELTQKADRLLRQSLSASVTSEQSQQMQDEVERISEQLDAMGEDLTRQRKAAGFEKPSDLEREDVKAGLKLMEKADEKVSEKIRTLIKEGKPQDQAVAIALDMKRRGEL